MKKLDKYKPFLGTIFGKLTLIDLIEGLSEKGKPSVELKFKCECGTEKIYSVHNARKIFTGETISCGCFRKTKWAREFHTWKVNWDKRFPE